MGVAMPEAERPYVDDEEYPYDCDNDWPLDNGERIDGDWDSGVEG